ncbi:MAG: peptidylprolyl isomerase [Planctomycetes bacterium]|nr:peptidylprolyl isomerase [Planctomycetota bacterium]
MEVDTAVSDVDFEKFDYQVELDTTMGKILLDLWPDVAPGHCKNIIGLTRIGFYNGVLFHRVVPGFMAQTGDPHGVGTGGPGYTIPAEFNDRKHVAGVLSMARGDAPGSAGSQFFICTDRAAHLDNKYTAFGKVADQASLDVVLKFNDVKTKNERPLEEIKINSAQVIVKPKSGE